METHRCGMDGVGAARRRRVRAALGLAVYVLLGVAASLCFKECGTDAERTWFYFTLGNTFGPLSLIFLMLAYSSMNANLASALAMGLGAVATQIAFWLVYAVMLSPLQWAGIGMVVAGAVIAVSGGRAGVAPQTHVTGETNA